MSAAGERKVHLNDATSAMLDESIDERVLFTRSDHWIGYEAANDALKAMADLVKQPRTTTSPSLLLLGRAGNGKTTILQRFASRFMPQTAPSGDIQLQLVHMTIPAAATEKDFWSELIVACHSVRRVTDPAPFLKNQAYGILASLKPRMLIGDEFNNLLIGNGANQRIVLARIREITNTFGIHLIFAGTEESSRASYNDPQIDRRLTRFELPRWKANMAFQKLLSSMEAFVPLPEPSGLGETEKAQFIFGRTDGTIGSISRFVKEAGRMAIEARRSSIDIEMLRRVRVDTPEERQKRALTL
ncbi:MAG: TniB family NTP-binding protein [Janthinobacterium lividum]